MPFKFNLQRYTPVPLNTLEMQKRLNRAIRVSPGGGCASWPTSSPTPWERLGGFNPWAYTGACAIIRKSILPFKIPEHQKTFLFGELCFVWAFSMNQLGEITLVKVWFLLCYWKLSCRAGTRTIGGLLCSDPGLKCSLDGTHAWLPHFFTHAQILT